MDLAVAPDLWMAAPQAEALYRIAQIRRRFGEAVVAIVDGCSDTDEVPKPPWQGRKEAYLARLGQETASVRLVSAADKLHNARDVLVAYRALGEAVRGRFTGGHFGPDVEQAYRFVLGLTGWMLEGLVEDGRSRALLGLGAVGHDVLG